MKKAFSIMFVTALLLTLVISSALASSTTTRDVEAIQEVATQYLTKSARNMYLYEENDLSALSIDAIMTTRASEEEITYKIGNKTVSMGSFARKMALAEDKVEYFKYIRSEQDFVISGFTQNYTIEDIQIFGKAATVRIYEALNWQYVDYHLPTSYGTTFEMTLVKDGGRWLVAEVVAPFDSFDKAYIEGTVPFDLEEKKASFDAFLVSEANRLEYFETSSIDFNTARESRVASSKSYSPSKAAEYALEYSSSSKAIRNEAFVDYTEYGGDCISFASQCVYAGLGGPWDTPDTSYMDTSSTYKWYYNDWSSWCSCGDFITYIESSDAKLNTDTLILDEGEDIPFWSTFDAYGCIGLVSNNKGQEYSHAIFIVDTASPDRKDWYYCAHTDEARNEKVSARYGDDPIYLIYPTSLS